VALLHSVRYQQSLRRYHARGVRPRDHQVGDLVLLLRQDARGRHKLTPPSEGPFIIAKILKPGTYKLANDQGEVYNNAWNIRQLCRFYPALPWQSPTLPRGLEGGNPLCVKIFLGKSLSARTSFALFDCFDSGILKTTEYT
jgi:hypothetical protein